MATIVQALENATTALNDAVKGIFSLRQQIVADFQAAKNENQKVVDDAIALQRVWIVDPVNGSDANDGSTLAKALKTLHAVTTQAPPSTDHFVYLMNDLVHEHYSQGYANITVRGSSPFPDPTGIYPFAAAKRVLSFRPIALESPLGGTQTTTSAFQMLHNMRLTGIDVILADVPAGTTQVVHFLSNNGSALTIDAGSILGTTPDNIGRLLGPNDAAPPGLYFYGSVTSPAQGRIFSGIAPGADPAANHRYVTNLTTN